MKDTSNIGNDDGKLPKGTIVWKKTRSDRYGNVIVKLKVLADGVVPTCSRTSDTYSGRKCRVPKAKVLGMWGCDSRATRNGLTKRLGSKREVSYSTHDCSFKYEVGKVVRPVYPFNSDAHSVCTSGIHVFRTKQEALDY